MIWHNRLMFRRFRNKPHEWQTIWCDHDCGCHRAKHRFGEREGIGSNMTQGGRGCQHGAFTKHFILDSEWSNGMECFKIEVTIEAFLEPSQRPFCSHGTTKYEERNGSNRYTVFVVQVGIGFPHFTRILINKIDCRHNGNGEGECKLVSLLRKCTSGKGNTRRWITEQEYNFSVDIWKCG